MQRGAPAHTALGLAIRGDGPGCSEGIPTFQSRKELKDKPVLDHQGFWTLKSSYKQLSLPSVRALSNFISTSRAEAKITEELSATE